MKTTPYYLKYSVLRLVFLVLFSLCFVGCEKDALKDETALESAQEIPSDGSMTFSELPPYIQSELIDTEDLLKKAAVQNKNGQPFGAIVRTEVSVLKTKEKATSYTLAMKHANQETFYYDNVVLVEDSLGGIQKHILRYEPEEDWVSERILGKSDYDSFTGKVSVYNGNGHMVASTFLKKGKVIGNQSKDGMSNKRVCRVIEVIYAGLYQNDTFYVTNISIRYSCNESSGGGGGPFVPGDGPSEPEGVEGPGRNSVPSIVVEDFDKQIIVDPSVTPCIKNLINQLKRKDKHVSVVPDILNSNGASHLSQIILDLFSTSSNHSLTFKIAQLGTDANGNEKNGSTRVINNGYEITIDTDLTNKGTQLSVAKTLIHESMHAFIKYIIRTNGASDLVTDIKTLYYQYQNGNNDNVALNLSHHQFMSQFVEALAYSLAAYDNHRLPIDYYRDLSWGGLETSPSYQQKSSTEKNRIQKNIINERYGTSSAKGIKCSK